MYLVPSTFLGIKSSRLQKISININVIIITFAMMYNLSD